jgi:hypothetical protein
MSLLIYVDLRESERHVRPAETRIVVSVKTWLGRPSERRMRRKMYPI